MQYKQVILVRHDLKLPKGKLAVQVAHASFESASNADKNIVFKWRLVGQKKIVLKVADEKELIAFRNEVERKGLPHALITDAGKTTIKPGTTTCLGIGPAEENKIDSITGKLKMV